MNRWPPLVGFLMIAIASNSTAMVLDFEDIGGFTTRANFPALGIENTYNGFQWPTEGGFQYWGVVNNTDSQFSTVGAFSGEQALWNWSDGPERNIIFDQLYDVEGAYFNVLFAGASWGADTVMFNAFDESDTLIGSSSLLSLNDSVANPAWQWLAADFTGVKRLQIIANDLDGGYDGGWWTMDNLTLSVSRVPEPSIVALFAAGLFGLGFARRRKA